jgi:hypothetical protein
MGENLTLEERIRYSTKLAINYPDYIPVIISKGGNDKILQDIDKTKYLIPKNLSVGEFLCIIRKKINTDSKQAIFVFIVVKHGSKSQSILVQPSQTFEQLYNQNRSDDHFLYLVYTSENTFG